MQLWCCKHGLWGTYFLKFLILPDGEDLGSKCSSRTSLFRQFDSRNRIKCWNSRTWLWLINSKSNFKLSTMLWFTNLSTTCLAQTYLSMPQESPIAHCGEYWVSMRLVVSRNIIFTTANNYNYSIVSKHSIQFQTWDGPHDIHNLTTI